MEPFKHEVADSTVFEHLREIIRGLEHISRQIEDLKAPVHEDHPCISHNYYGTSEHWECINCEHIRFTTVVVGALEMVEGVEILVRGATRK